MFPGVMKNRRMSCMNIQRKEHKEYLVEFQCFQFSLEQMAVAMATVREETVSDF